MKAMINEEGIMEVKALVMSRGIFKQLREVQQKELESIYEDIHILGYANEPEGLTWIIAQHGKTIIRSREVNLFWIMRPDFDGNMNKVSQLFQDKLHSHQQIFIK